jgi:hypothetical protein
MLIDLDEAVEDVKNTARDQSRGEKMVCWIMRAVTAVAVLVIVWILYLWFGRCGG